MPIAPNSDGTIWIDINEMTDIEEVQATLVAMGVPVAAVSLDPESDVAVRAVKWSEVYPKIVPRNGPAPGIIVDPTQIPGGHTLLLAVQPLIGPDRYPETATVLHLIQGPLPNRFGRIVGDTAPSPPPATRPPKPPPKM